GPGVAHAGKARAGGNVLAAGMRQGGPQERGKKDGGCSHRSESSAAGRMWECVMLNGEATASCPAIRRRREALAANGSQAFRLNGFLAGDASGRFSTAYCPVPGSGRSVRYLRPPLHHGYGNAARQIL